jgi:hypothetical protein
VEANQGVTSTQQKLSRRDERHDSYQRPNLCAMPINGALERKAGGRSTPRPAAHKCCRQPSYVMQLGMTRFLPGLVVLLIVGCGRENHVGKLFDQNCNRLAQSVTNEAHIEKMRLLTGIPSTANLSRLPPASVQGDATCCIIGFERLFISNDRMWQVQESYYYDLDLFSSPIPMKLSVNEIDTTGRENRVVRRDVWWFMEESRVPKKAPTFTPRSEGSVK